MLSLLLVVIGLLFLKLALNAWKRMTKTDFIPQEIQAAGAVSLGVVALSCFGGAIALVLIT